MIQANELRKGNLILKNDSVADEPETISVSVHDFYWVEKYPDEYEGIPLTEEWLQKFGFIKYEYGKDKEFIGYQNHWVNGFLNPGNCFCLLGHEDRHQNIISVHQLQNLYFALTGKELELKKENV